MASSVIEQACLCGARTLDLCAGRMRKALVELKGVCADPEVAPTTAAATFAQVSAAIQAVRCDLEVLDRKLGEARMACEGKAVATAGMGDGMGQSAA